jgi:hypothetical protein
MIAKKRLYLAILGVAVILSVAFCAVGKSVYQDALFYEEIDTTQWRDSPNGRWSVGFSFRMSVVSLAYYRYGVAVRDNNSGEVKTIGGWGADEIQSTWIGANVLKCVVVTRTKRDPWFTIDRWGDLSVIWEEK